MSYSKNVLMKSLVLFAEIYQMDAVLNLLITHEKKINNIILLLVKQKSSNILSMPKGTGCTFGLSPQIDFITSNCRYNILWLSLLVPDTKNVRKLSWMSHGVMRFWFLWNFLFISASFDILASLSIYRVFSSTFSGRWTSSCLDILRTIIKFD